MISTQTRLIDRHPENVFYPVTYNRFTIVGAK
jgi:hypothetical protein